MQILFIASIQGKTGREADYKAIVSSLTKISRDVVSDHVMKHSQRDLDGWTSDKKVEFHKKLLDGIKKADVVVAEISYSSMSVGYLVSVAIDFGKPTILMYRGDVEPNLLTTLATTDKLQVIRYMSIGDIEKELPEFVSYAIEKVDTRFNFFISPEIGAYLDWISKKRRIPRAVFLRRLIEREMKENTEYRQK